MGGHIRKEDVDIEDDKLSIIKNALTREIKEEIHLRLSISKSLPKLVYSVDLEKSRRHLAVYWVIEIDSDKLNVKADGNELLNNRGTTTSGKFFEISKLDRSFSLETWSKLILLNEFKEKINDDFKDYLLDFNRQLTLFNI